MYDVLEWDAVLGWGTAMVCVSLEEAEEYVSRRRDVRCVIRRSK